MKLNLYLYCALLLLIGCTRYDPAPIRIRLSEPGKYELNGVFLNQNDLKDALRANRETHGCSMPVIFEVSGESTYSILSPGIDLAAACGYWRFHLALNENDPGRQFILSPGDGPPSIDIDIDLANEAIFADGVFTTNSLDEILTGGTNAWFSVWILPAESTRISQLKDILEHCSEHSCRGPYIVPREKRIPYSPSNNRH